MAKLRYGLLAQALLYTASGVNHFVHQGFYLHIMPDHYADPAAMVKWSGVAEIAGGLGLLVPATRRVAAGGLVAMLAVFLDVHQYMARHPERFPEVPQWALWGRIPIQLALMAWAGWYARLPQSAGRSEAGQA